MLRTRLALLLTATVLGPAFGQELSASGDLKTMVLKHLKTSQEFTVKVAEAMPEADYDFKLTPDQMTFGGQITHLARRQFYTTSRRFQLKRLRHLSQHRQKKPM